MKITLNGDTIDVSAKTLAQLVDERGFTDKIIATAVNGEFVPIPIRQDQELTDGDRVEFVAPMQGG